MKNAVTYLFAGLALLALAGSVQADVTLQIWECELDDDATEADLVELSKAWTAAAKTIEGVEGVEVYLNYPITGDLDDGEFLFIMVLPSATAWGMFEDGYPDSAAAEVDERWGEIATCSESSLWSSVAMQ